MKRPLDPLAAEMTAAMLNVVCARIPPPLFNEAKKQGVDNPINNLGDLLYKINKENRTIGFYFKSSPLRGGDNDLPFRTERDTK